MKFSKIILSWIIVSCLFMLTTLLPSCSLPANSNKTSNQHKDKTVTITFPSNKYPTVADHIRAAIAKGKPNTCTINRKGAEQNRKESLKNVPPRKGYDRDEYPMAMCKEGGKGADVRYIKPKENRGAGSWFSNRVKKYPNGTVVIIEVN